MGDGRLARPLGGGGQDAHPPSSQWQDPGLAGPLNVERFVFATAEGRAFERGPLKRNEAMAKPMASVAIRTNRPVRHACRPG